MHAILLIISCLSMNVFTDITDFGDLKQISQTVQEFSASADIQSPTRMDAILHNDFRVVANQLFGSSEVSLIDKKSYLDLLKAGKVGGDTRQVIIHSITMEGNNAFVSASFTGNTLIFNTFIQLVKSDTGQWTIIGDMPTIKKVE